MAFDVPTTRGTYTSLSDGWTYLNGAERPQIPARISAAVSTSFRTAPKKLRSEPSSGHHSRSREAGTAAAAEMAMTARRAFADMVGGRASNVVLGSSRYHLMQQLMQAMGRRLTLGTEVVLSRTGRPSSRVPVERAADMFGTKLRYAEADLSTGVVPSWQFDGLVNRRTRLVVVPAADPHVGAVSPVRKIADIAHQNPEAWVLVDATDYAPHRVVDMLSLGADIVLVDAAQWGGPEVSALVFRDPSMFRRLSSVSLNPDADGLYRVEVDSPAPGLLGGVAESVQHVAMLDRAAKGTRRRRIEQSVPQVGTYIETLTNRLIDGLRYLDRVHIVCMDPEDSSSTDGVSAERIDRVGRVSFIVNGVPADTVVRRLMDNGVVTSMAERGNSGLLEAIGVFEEGGAVVVGLQPFNLRHDVDQLIRVVRSLG